MLRKNYNQFVSVIVKLSQCYDSASSYLVNLVSFKVSPEHFQRDYIFQFNIVGCHSRHRCVASLSWPELGTAQPQLV